MKVNAVRSDKIYTKIAAAPMEKKNDIYNTQEYICIIGNTSIDCIFQLSLFYYDEDGNIAMNKELDTLDVNITGNSADYAVAAETIKIVIMRTSD